jgi:hypothetical protein
LSLSQIVVGHVGAVDKAPKHPIAHAYVPTATPTATAPRAAPCPWQSESHSPEETGSENGVTTHPPKEHTDPGTHGSAAVQADCPTVDQSIVTLAHVAQSDSTWVVGAFGLQIEPEQVGVD